MPDRGAPGPHARPSGNAGPGRGTRADRCPGSLPAWFTPAHARWLGRVGAAVRVVLNAVGSRRSEVGSHGLKRRTPHAPWREATDDAARDPDPSARAGG